MAINAMAILSAHPLIKFIAKMGFGRRMVAQESPAETNIVKPW